MTENNHSSSFDIDETVLMQGVQILSFYCSDFLKKPEEYIHDDKGLFSVT